MQPLSTLSSGLTLAPSASTGQSAKWVGTNCPLYYTGPCMQGYSTIYRGVWDTSFIISLHCNTTPPQRRVNMLSTRCFDIKSSHNISLHYVTVLLVTYHFPDASSPSPSPSTHYRYNHCNLPHCPVPRTSYHQIRPWNPRETLTTSYPTTSPLNFALQQQASWPLRDAAAPV